jgi:uncharacterized protein (TIGR02145 family)
MKIKSYKTLLALFLLSICAVLNAQERVTDIDGNVYNTVTIGSQKWMQENLKTTHYSNGDSIGTTWPATYYYMSESKPKYQWSYSGNDSLSDIYGRLYTWYAATDNRNVCPIGWHLPSYSEWKSLIDYLGKGMVAHGKLKETDTIHWKSPNADATNESGFTGLPGGSHWDSTFLDMGTCGHYWSASQETSEWSYRMLLNFEAYDATYFLNSASPKIGWSVRCIEDPIPDSAKYFGQNIPGDTAIVFAPEFFSNTHPLELKMAFSTDGSELYYSVYTDSFKIYFTKRVNNSWTEPAEAPFSVNHNALSPSFSADGNSLYFTYINLTSYVNKIYKVERTTGGWSEPQILPSPININNESDYAETTDSIAYISSNRNNGDWDIWCIRRLSDSSFQAVSLGSNVNSNEQDSYPCVAPDGSYLIFSSTRSGSHGNQDLYICFNKGNNKLTAPINMERSGAKINIANSFQDYPSLSPDGKFLFFRRANFDFSTTNVYWVSTHIIDTLKKIAFPTSDVNGRETENLISVFPNPSEGVFTIMLESNLVKNATAEIFTMDGKLALRQNIWNKSVTIDLAAYAKGIYIVKITAESKIFIKKIILK